jgi:aminoglycoside 3-N-acetyltransferase
MAFSKEELLKQLKEMGVSQGTLLHLQVSVRSVGLMSEGVSTLLNALLDAVGSDGAIVANSFLQSYPLPLSVADAHKISRYDSPSYAGVLVNAMVQYPEMLRSSHPIQKYVAIGQSAKKLIDGHNPDSGAYDLLEAMALSDGWNLTIGDKPNVTSTGHVAVEELPYKKRSASRGVNYEAGFEEIKLFEANYRGGCTRGYPKFIPHYKSEGILKIGQIGQANAYLTKMSETLRIERRILKDNPAFFFCNDPTCKDCRLRWEHSNGSFLAVKYHSALKILRDWVYERKS